MAARSCSIIVDNFNYAQFLPTAVDSALAQDYPEVEVIVVDDGSTDDSRRVIESYGDRVTPVLKENGGQGSAFNAGAARSSGDVVFFLDADDLLYPFAVSTVMPLFANPDVVKVHWPLNMMEVDGTILDVIGPPRKLPSGDLSAGLLASGPPTGATVPTSGNAWRRTFLDRVLPVPEDVYRLQPDEYLDTTAMALGRVELVDRPLAAFRCHDSWTAKRDQVVGEGFVGGSASTARDRLAWDAEHDRVTYPAVAAALERNGIRVELDEWLRNSHWLRLEQAVQTVITTIPPGTTFVLADEDSWDVDGLFGDRRPLSAKWLMADADVEQWLESLVPALAPHDYLVLGWQAFWYVDFHPSFARRLAEQFRPVAENHAVRVFERTRPAPDQRRQRRAAPPAA